MTLLRRYRCLAAELPEWLEVEVFVAVRIDFTCTAQLLTTDASTPMNTLCPIET